jgi:arginine decarboxylase-like protein
MNASELVIQLHDLARETKDNRIRTIADNLAEVAKDHSDKGYRESTHEKQAEFAKKRNEGFYDVGSMSLDEVKRSNRE